MNCTGEQKCWQHYQGNYALTRERDILLALGLAQLLVRSQLYEVEHCVEALRRVDLMRSLQWCQMVRKPFDFPKPEPTHRRTAPPTTLNELENLL